MTSFSDKRSGTVRVIALVSVLALLAGCEKELILTGERFDPRAPLDASVPVEGEAAPVDTSGVIENKSVAISLPGAAANADWTHRAANSSHLMPNAVLSATPTRVWSVNIGAGSSRKYRIAAAPVVADGRVFAMDANSDVSAVSASGAKLWSADLTPQGARGQLSGGGLAYGAGRLFAATGGAELVALDPATGGVVWRQNLGAPAAGAPTVSDGMVYVVARNGTALAIRVTDGRIEWQIGGTPSLSGMIGSAAPAVAASSVLFPFTSGEVLAALKIGGAPVWRANVAGARLGRGYSNVTDITGDPVVAGKVTYIGNQSGKTAAFETDTGKRIWTAGEAAYGPVLAVGGSVFLVSDEARLVRLDAATGARIWSVEMPYYTNTRDRKRARITPHFGPVLASGRLIVASGDGALRLFNPVDGSSLGMVDLPGGAASGPALAGGTLYVVSKNGQLHAFR